LIRGLEVIVVDRGEDVGFLHERIEYLPHLELVRLVVCDLLQDEVDAGTFGEGTVADNVEDGGVEGHVVARCRGGCGVSWSLEVVQVDVNRVEQVIRDLVEVFNGADLCGQEAGGRHGSQVASNTNVGVFSPPRGLVARRLVQPDLGVEQASAIIERERDMCALN